MKLKICVKIFLHSLQVRLTILANELRFFFRANETKRIMDQNRQNNYKHAQEQARQYVGSILSHEQIKHLHSFIIGDSNLNNYRKGRGSPRVYNAATRQIRFLPPDSETHPIHELMSELLQWLSELSLGLEPIETAARLHWALVKIHPFDDGNGRLSRLLFCLVLFQDSYNESLCQHFENYVEANRNEYDDALDDGNLFYSDFKNITTKWLNFAKNYTSLL